MTFLNIGVSIKMIPRKRYLGLLNEYATIFPICALLGPRQAGKTTLALEYAKKFSNVIHFDLEDPIDYEKLKNPKETLPINIRSNYYR